MKIYCYGDCPLRDASKQMKKMGLNSEYYANSQVTTLLSNPEKRIRDIAKEWWHKNLEKKFNNELRVRTTVDVVYKELIENNPLASNQIPTDKNGILVVSHSHELNPRWCKDNEYVMLSDLFLRQLLHCVQNYNFPVAIYELLIDPRYIIPFNDERHLHLLKHEFGPMYCELLHSKFGNRTLLFGSEPATKYYNRRLGFYYDMPSFNADSIIYKRTNSPKYSAAESNYPAQKVLKYAFTGLRRTWPTKGSEPLNHLWISEKHLVGDDHHSLGRHSFHYDKTSCKFIANKIVKEVNKIQNIGLIDVGTSSRIVF